MKNVFNINFPIKDSDKGFFVDLTQDKLDGILADVRYLLSTTKGTRYYRPDFGVNLRKYLFDQNDDIVFNKIKEEISESITKYFPNITVESIERLVVDKPNKLFNEDYLGNRTSTKSPSVNNVMKIRIKVKVKLGAFTSSEIIDLEV